MESEQFSSLGDRIKFDFSDQDKSTKTKTTKSSLNIPRRITFALFDEIVEDSPSQTRSVIFDPKRNPEDLELLESIKQNGIINPIIVRGLGQKDDLESLHQKKTRKRNFALVAGHRRVAAGRAAGLAGTDAVIAKTSDDYQLLTLIENMGRRELTSYEKALALNNFKLREKLSVRKVAENTGFSKTHVGRLLSSLESPEVLQKLWKRGTLSATVIVNIKDYWHLFTEGKADHLVKKMRNLTQKESQILCDHLGSGLDLEIALNEAKARRRFTGRKKSNKNGSSELNLGNIPFDNITPAEGNVKGIAKNIHAVFPGITESKARALFLSAVSANVLDTDVLWAAALLIARGGSQESAIDTCAKVMSSQEYRTLVSNEVKAMQQISNILKSRSTHSNLKKFFRTIYIGS